MANATIWADSAQRCGTTHNFTAISATSGATSFLLFVTTVPINLLVIVAIYRGRKKKFKNIFYKLVLNLAIADLFTGMLSDTTMLNFQIKEIFNKITTVDIYAVHLSVFVFGSVGLTSMVMLSIDRSLALVTPIRYHNGIADMSENFIVVSSWLLGWVLVAPYFVLGYVSQLAVYALSTVSVALVSMVVNAFVYKTRLVRTVGRGSNYNEDETEMAIPVWKFWSKIKARSDSTLSTSSNNLQSETSTTDFSTISSMDSQQHQQRSAKRSREQVKVTRIFYRVLFASLVTYLPTCVMIAYMNTCERCNCLLIHIMRDLSILCILTNSLLRALCFTLSINHLNVAVKRMIASYLPKRKEKENSNFNGRSIERSNKSFGQGQ